MASSPHLKQRKVIKMAKDPTKESVEKINAENTSGETNFTKTKEDLYNTARMSAAQRDSAPPLTADQIKQQSAVYTVGDNSGLMNANVTEPQLSFLHSLSDAKVGKSNNNANIVFGRDRPSSLPSGFGGTGAQGANAIDIIVGRMSSSQLKGGAVVNPNFASDACRIYLSQLTNIDTNFGLAPGRNGNVETRSGIGIKADSVRIIGKDGGVKIVTGRSFAFKGTGLQGEQNSLGGNISKPAPPIELIAGNTTEPRYFTNPLEGQGPMVINTLQGIAMGDNTTEAIAGLGDLLEELMAIVHNIAIMQTVYNTVNGIDYWRPWMGGQGSATSLDYCLNIVSSSWQNRINKIMWQVNYTEPFGARYLPSRNVFCT